MSMIWLSGHWKITDWFKAVQVLDPQTAALLNDPASREAKLADIRGSDLTRVWFLAKVLRERNWKFENDCIYPMGEVPSFDFYQDTLVRLVEADCIQPLQPGPMTVYMPNSDTLYRFIVYRTSAGPELVTQGTDIDSIWPRNPMIDGVD